MKKNTIRTVRIMYCAFSAVISDCLSTDWCTLACANFVLVLLQLMRTLFSGQLQLAERGW